MGATTDFQDRRRTVTATIANGTALSAAVDLAGCDLVAIQMPAAWTTADLTFQAASDGVTFGELYDATGTERDVKAAASQVVTLTPADWVGLRWLKVRSGTSGVPVNQGADRSITLIVRPVAG